MRLYIDTTDSERVKIKLDDQEFIAETRAQELVKLIDKSLKALNKKPEDLTKIEVNTGPGSFTGVRIGISVAQALRWSIDK